jgi:hypothetical protein
MTEFTLINPHIEGKFQKLYRGETAFDAAKNTWDNLSKNFTNYVPEFAFTIERAKDKKMFHYKVNESVSGDNVNYTIIQLDDNITDAQRKKFNDKLAAFKTKIQRGGKDKADDDDDNDDDDDDRKSRKDRKRRDKHKRRRKVSLLEDEDEDESTTEDIYDLYLLNTSYLYDSPIAYFWYYPDFYSYATEYYILPTWIPSVSPSVFISY